MILGILAGLTTGALWGLTFVAPHTVAPFTTLDLTIARYTIFGIVSLGLMLHPAFRPKRLKVSQYARALLLGSIGYVGYFLCAAYAVILAGPAIPPLIIGILPVALALAVNLRRPSVSWGRLALPLALIAAGVCWVNASTLSSTTADLRASVLLGTICALLALAIWIIYGLVNAAALEGPHAPSSLSWTGLQGIGAMLGTFPLAAAGALTDAPWFFPHPVASSEGLSFLAWAIVLGVAGSWLATWFWVIASRRLPLALSAQLIVSETVFGLFYGFAYQGRWPNLSEGLGALLQILGVAMAVAVFTRSREVSSANASALPAPPDAVTLKTSQS
jgi:drug/metabolite transporter (DMT)-like permease